MSKIALVASGLVAAGVGTYILGSWDAPERSEGSANAAPAVAEKSSIEAGDQEVAAATAPSDRPALASAAAGETAGRVGEPDMARLGLRRGPSRGPADAPVEIVVFTDFGCSLSGRVLGTLDELWDEYPSLLRLVVKQFPILPGSDVAAQAALAAQEQGKFWELHDQMLANQNDLSRDSLLRHARRAGLDVEELRRSLDDGRYANQVAGELAAAKEIGVRGTPYFLINSRLVAGARPIDEFHGLIRQELEAVAPDRLPALAPHQNPTVPADPGACDCGSGESPGCDTPPQECDESRPECEGPPQGCDEQLPGCDDPAQGCDEA